MLREYYKNYRSILQLNSQKLKQLKTLTEKQYAKALIIYKVHRT